MCPVCLSGLPQGKQGVIPVVSLSLIHSVILLSWSCVWTGSSVWAALPVVMDAEKGHGFLLDRYHCCLVELAGLKCPSCTQSHVTACLFAVLEVLLLAATPQELLLQVGGGRGGLGCHCS